MPPPVIKQCTLCGRKVDVWEIQTNTPGAVPVQMSMCYYCDKPRKADADQ